MDHPCIRRYALFAEGDVEYRQSVTTPFRDQRGTRFGGLLLSGLVCFAAAACGHVTAAATPHAASDSGFSCGPPTAAPSTTTTTRVTLVPQGTDTVAPFQDPLPTNVLGSPIRQSPTGAKSIILSAADCQALGAAYSDLSGFSDCPVLPMPGTVKAAVITATRVEWAFGLMESQPGCMPTAGDGTKFDPNDGYPFAAGSMRGGVFERQPGAPWQMNSFQSNPFPCPALNTPGNDNPYVPLAVLDAVGVSYAPSGCDHMLILDARGPH